VKTDTKAAAQLADGHLSETLERMVKESYELIEKKDLPATISHFAEAREIVRELIRRAEELKEHIDRLSHELLPTMFENSSVKTINVVGVGRATVNDHWFVSLVDKQTGLDWLRLTGNEGLIIETVNSQTLGAFAKEEVKAKRSLPDDIFRVYTQPYISITKT
jgi:hypothetical protein